MIEYIGILTRDPVILEKVSYCLVQTDNGLINIVCFAIAELARANLASLASGEHVTVRGVHQKNKQSGLDELIVSYVAKLELNELASLTPPTVTELLKPLDRITKGLEAYKILDSLTQAELEEVRSKLREFKQEEKKNADTF